MCLSQRDLNSELTFFISLNARQGLKSLANSESPLKWTKELGLSPL